MKRNLQWIRKGVQKIVNFNDDQPDEDFGGTDDDDWDDVDFAINDAYEEFLNSILTEGDPELLLIHDDVTWKSGELTLRLPEHLDGDMIQAIDDVTSANPGSRQRIFQRGIDYGSTIFPVTGTTFQWGSTGAPSTKTLRIFYYPLAKEMKDPVDEPIYCPLRFRRILMWDGAINLRTMAEDAAPPRWVMKRDKIWDTVILAVSEGRPVLGNRARIQMEEHYGDFF